MSQEEVTKDTLSLLEAFYIVLEANRGVPSDADDRVLDAEGVAMKCFFHASSCFYLHRSTTIPELGASFFDHASMSVLARATIEAFLVFQYVFVSPATENEREFRHQSWVLADLLDRQDAPATLPESQQKQREERTLIDDIRARLRANPEFAKLTPPQQTQLLERRRWRWDGWTTIARNAGLSDLHAESAYRFLSSFAHSGSVSVLQVRQAKSREDQQFLSTSHSVL